MSIWNAKTEALLLESFKQGHSRSQTAAYVSLHGGVKVSRSAAIGKLNRMGYSEPESATTRSLRMKQVHRKRQVEEGPRPLAHKPAPTRVTKPFRTFDDADAANSSGPPLPLPADDPLPEHKLKALVDLEHGECRWPYGDPGAPGFGFCGQPHFPGMPYCDGHCRRAYAPPVPRSRVPADRYAVVPTPQKQDA